MLITSGSERVKRHFDRVFLVSLLNSSVSLLNLKNTS